MRKYLSTDGVDKAQSNGSLFMPIFTIGKRIDFVYLIFNEIPKIAVAWQQLQSGIQLEIFEFNSHVVSLKIIHHK